MRDTRDAKLMFDCEHGSMTMARGWHQSGESAEDNDNDNGWGKNNGWDLSILHDVTRPYVWSTTNDRTYPV
jgi:hypothetical protein